MWRHRYEEVMYSSNVGQLNVLSMLGGFCISEFHQFVPDKVSYAYDDYWTDSKACMWRRAEMVIMLN